MSPRTIFRQVATPVLDLQNVQLTISIAVDKGLLDKSSVVRVRLRMGHAPPSSAPGPEPVPTPSGADESDDGEQGLMSDVSSPHLTVPTTFDEIFEFPTESETQDTSGIADAAAVATPRWAHRLKSLLRATTLLAFGAGVVVGASVVIVSVPRPAPPVVSGPPAPRVPVADVQPIPASAPRARLSRAAIVTATDSAGEIVNGVYRSTLVVESNPDGAGVYLNNQPVGTTPLNLDGLPVGSRAVRLELPGYERWSSAVTVTAQQVARVSADLHPIEPQQP